MDVKSKADGGRERVWGGVVGWGRVKKGGENENSGNNEKWGGKGDGTG